MTSSQPCSIHPKAIVDYFDKISHIRLHLSQERTIYHYDLNVRIKSKV